MLLIGFLHSRGRASGAEVRVPFGQLAQFRDGLVVRLDAFPDHASAREAAGLATRAVPLANPAYAMLRQQWRNALLT